MSQVVTKISDIKAGMRDLTVRARVVDVGPTREVETRYGRASLAVARLEDETGSISLNLWREQVGKAKKGSTILVRKAFAKSFGGSVEISVGKDGSISVVA